MVPPGLANFFDHLELPSRHWKVHTQKAHHVACRAGPQKRGRTMMSYPLITLARHVVLLSIRPTKVTGAHPQYWWYFLKSKTGFAQGCHGCMFPYSHSNFMHIFLPRRKRERTGIFNNFIWTFVGDLHKLISPLIDNCTSFSINS